MEGPSPSRSLPPAQSGQWGETGNLQPVVPGASPAGLCRQPPARSWAHRAAEHGGGGDQPQHPELPLERPLHQGSARAPPGAGLCLQSGAGTPGMVGSSYPRAPAPSAPRPSRHCGGDRKRAPKDEGMGMTCPGLSLAVATAEPRQHEMLLAKQPGDPAEEIGPFKRDSDK